MATSRPTSRQLKGQFDALRPSKSHLASETIDIKSGTYGNFKTFAGATGVSHVDWVGATATFYVYLDSDEDLVLNGTSGFPILSTRIGRVILDSGTITDVVDERAEVNGLLDAYQIGFDDANVSITFGEDVQEAIENLDAYVSSLQAAQGADITRFVDFGIDDGIKNGRVNITIISVAPAIEYAVFASGIGRVAYTISIPEDYVSATDIVIKTFWSPEDASSGDVQWRMRYRLVASGTEDVDTPATSVLYAQSTPGATNRLTDTGDNLIIPSSDISSGDILMFSIERLYTTPGDTYSGAARVHRVRMEYTGRGVE